jgi:molybdate transport system substrate-binding protein
MLKLSRAVAGAFFVLVFASAGVRAAEVNVLAVGVFPGAFKELVPQFESASGHKVTVQYGATPGLIKQIEAGETFDVAILITGPMNEAATKGYFAAGACPLVSSVGLGAAVRAGSPKPDISSPEAFKQTLLKAKSVAILPESVNGKHFLSVFDRIGIGEEMKARIKPQKAPDEVAQAVAKGEADFALFVSNQLIGVPGVDYVGPVPKEFQQTLVFAAAVGAKAKEPEPANAFITYLTSPAAAGLMKKCGMDVPQP